MLAIYFAFTLHIIFSFESAIWLRRSRSTYDSIWPGFFSYRFCWAAIVRITPLFVHQMERRLQFSWKQISIACGFRATSFFPTLTHLFKPFCHFVGSNHCVRWQISIFQRVTCKLQTFFSKWDFFLFCCLLFDATNGGNFNALQLHGCKGTHLSSMWQYWEWKKNTSKMPFKMKRWKNPICWSAAVSQFSSGTLFEITNGQTDVNFACVQQAYQECELWATMHFLFWYFSIPGWHIYGIKPIKCISKLTHTLYHTALPRLHTAMPVTVAFCTDNTATTTTTTATQCLKMRNNNEYHSPYTMHTWALSIVTVARLLRAHTQCAVWQAKGRNCHRHWERETHKNTHMTREIAFAAVTVSEAPSSQWSAATNSSKSSNSMCIDQKC